MATAAVASTALLLLLSAAAAASMAQADDDAAELIALHSHDDVSTVAASTPDHPHFVATFDITKNRLNPSEEYIDLMVDIWNRIPYSGRRALDRPILLPHTDPPREWFHVVLEADANKITLAVRADDLYLVGFRRTHGPGQWWEFKPETGGKTLLPNSRSLGYTGSYEHLISGGAAELTRLLLGTETLVRAVDTLAGLSGDTEKAKRHLAAIIVMVLEASRFRSVRDYTDRLLRTQAEHGVTEVLRQQIGGWKKISRAMIDWQENGKDRHHPELVPMGIRSWSDAQKITALVRNVPPGASLEEADA